MKHDEIIGFTASSISTFLTITQTKELFQTVQLVLSCLCFVVTILYTVWKWYKNATKEDSPGGTKITVDEVENLFDNLKDNIKNNEEEKRK